ncbi:MAG: hypothetical protein JSU01_18520 [Bacteroidetes bacterium]|nr:hypothetical protein [Bacteroidota bacterium]
MHLALISDFQFWFIVIIQIAGFILVCLKLYAKAYSTEKGKNLATKEDIGEITQIVESIKTSLAKETEELKSDLSFKSEHLIHLRAAERAAIINYYKATWVLVLNFRRPDLIKNEIDDFDEKDGMVSDLELRRYISEAESILNKTKEEVSNLKYLRDISESELMFFYDDKRLNAVIDELNLSLSQFERYLTGSINSLLQVFAEINIKISAGQLAKESIIEAKRKRSDILTNWYANRYNSLSFIRTFNQNLKNLLHDRLTKLAS